MKKIFLLRLYLFALMISLLPSVTIVSCGKEDEGDGGVKAPFSPWGKTSVSKLETTTVDGTPTELTVQYIGDEIFNNQTMEHYKGTYLVSEGTKTVDCYGVYHGDGKIEFAGFSVKYPPGSGKKDYTVTLDEVVSLDEKSIPIGVEQNLAISGSITIGNGVPVSGRGHIQFTKTSEDSTVETNLGTISGVHVFEGEGIIEDVGGTDLWNRIFNQQIRIEAWYHPVLGILKIEAPDMGLGTKLLGEYDCGNPNASDYNTIQKVAVISKENPDFELSSYLCSGQYDADKMRHAKMYLELRWMDGTKAKTDQRPEVEVMFETGWGYFPFILVQSPVSIFHPEENKEGYTYWYAYVDEAAKNEPGGNGILYKIKVTFPDYMTSPVRVTARIHYPIYRP